MSNYGSLNLYLVRAGEVQPGSTDSEWDGIESILVAATSEAAALDVAAAYDAGDVGPDNLWWYGEAVAAVWLRDSDTGLYA